ncbi:hypothetical protein PVL29_019320 [Vitis rotundifolia]|uniref:Uncharacterized protein n=1 Tax=Vitis rotundifolia TaxID=103349 RepID=A0AA39DGY1_VITRO|nr:hypothetical protein PVL29_019320 [Vitis rotundifolia]
MAKVFALFLLALLAISMLHTTVLASHGHGGHHYNQNARHSARGGAARRSTTNLACSSVRNAAKSACAFPQGIMASYGLLDFAVSGHFWKMTQVIVHDAMESLHWGLSLG